MATFKPTVRSVRNDGFMQVYIRVTHRTKHGYIKTDKMITKRELNKQGDIRDPFVLNYCMDRIMEFNERLNRKDISKWTVAQVVEFLKHGDDDVCFSDYARVHIDRLIDNGQERTSRNYKLALQHMERFLGTNRIMFGELTSVQVNRWIASLEHTRRAKEMYPVCMRQVFKAAMTEFNDYDNGIIRIKTNPWGKVKIPESDRADKKAISAEACRLFFSAPLPETRCLFPTAELGRDVAMLVLCLAGINTVDLYGLKKGDYRDGVICYKRAKTMKFRRDDAYFEIRVEPFVRPLLEKYMAVGEDEHLLSFASRFSSADSFNANVNSGIKQICKSMGMAKVEWYSAYTFRHTWGTTAQNDCGASISEVAFGMNHSQGHGVTRGYIKMDFSPAWELNARVIDFIFFSTARSKQGKAGGVEEPNDTLFRLSPKYMVYARAYFRGEVLAEVSDVGFGTVGDVVNRLAEQLPETIPRGCAVQFRIKNVDTDREVVYERTKGKGFF
ncbi:MAG: site-specific integrase [Bacteroides sp.]|nr:site-specific integrase [Bacteroides sp.]